MRDWHFSQSYWIRNLLGLYLGRVHCSVTMYLAFSLKFKIQHHGGHSRLVIHPWLSILMNFELIIFVVYSLSFGVLADFSSFAVFMFLFFHSCWITAWGNLFLNISLFVFILWGLPIQNRVVDVSSCHFFSSYPKKEKLWTGTLELYALNTTLCKLLFHAR